MTASERPVILAIDDAVRANPMSNRPCEDLLAPPSSDLPQPLTDAVVIEVLAHPNPSTPIGLRNRALLETGYSTALRRIDLIRLRLHDLDLARGVVVVREGQGQKDRVVPIGERAIAWLEKKGGAVSRNSGATH